MARAGVPSPEQLRRLGALRIRAGLTLDQVAERSGLPVAHVQALEQARIVDLPAGPYVAAYYRLVLGVVGGTAELDEVPEPDDRPEPIVATWVARGAAALAILGLIGAMTFAVRERGVAPLAALSGAGGAAPVERADLRIELQALRAARFVVRVDGELALDETLPPRAERSFVGRDRIEVDLAGAETAQINYNGQPLRPQGRQGVPRRLVFIDDLSPGE